jgi:hypothetical protein
MFVVVVFFYITIFCFALYAVSAVKINSVPTFARATIIEAFKSAIIEWNPYACLVRSFLPVIYRVEPPTPISKNRPVTKRVNRIASIERHRHRQRNEKQRDGEKGNTSESDLGKILRKIASMLCCTSSSITRLHLKRRQR